MDLVSSATPEKWAKSKAKAILRGAILSGDAKDSMKPKEVCELNDEFKKFRCERFRSNPKTMRKAHKAGTLGKQKGVKWGKSEAKDFFVMI